MRLGGAIGAMLAAAIALCAPNVRGDTQVQGAIAGSVGYTDNVNGGPSEPVQGRAPPEGAFFAEVSPGVGLSFTTPRATYSLGYTFSAGFASGTQSYVNRLDGGGLFLLSPTTELSLGVTAALGHSTAIARTADAARRQLEAQPAGTSVFGLVGLSQGIGKELSEDVRLTQRATFTAGTPIGAELPFTRTWDLGGAVGLHRTFPRDAVGGELRANYTLNAIIRAQSTVPLYNHLLATTAVAQWFHDIGHFWSTQLEAGLLHVMSLEQGGWILQPAGAAALRYARDEGSAELSYAHAAQSNPLVGQTFLNDSVSLRGSVPLGQTTNLVLSSSVGYQHGTEIRPNYATLGASLDIVAADVMLAWAPVDGLTLSARYQRLQQLASDAGAAGTSAAPSVVTNTGLLTAAVGIPMTRGASVVYRPPLRVDRSDMIGDPRRTESHSSGRE